MKRCMISLILSTLVLLTAFCSACFSAEKVKPTGPCDTLRDYIAALEARGKIL